MATAAPSTASRAGSKQREGHGDVRLRKQIFAPYGQDPYRQAAGTRDGATACLAGIAARHGIDGRQPVKIGSLPSPWPPPTRGT